MKGLSAAHAVVLYWQRLFEEPLSFSFLIMAGSYRATLGRSVNACGEASGWIAPSTTSCPLSTKSYFGRVVVLESLEPMVGQLRRDGHLKPGKRAQSYFCKCTSNGEPAAVRSGLRQSAPEMGRMQRSGRNKTSKVQAFPTPSRTTEPAQVGTMANPHVAIINFAASWFGKFWHLWMIILRWLAQLLCNG